MTSLAEVAAATRRELELRWAAQEQREIELTEAEKWARDPEGWIEQHVWIASPFDQDGQETGKLRPVKLRMFPAQRQTLRSWIDIPRLQSTGELVFNNLAIEKSRQIGETWIFAAAIAWLLHYHLVNMLAMHTKSAKIDDGGTRSTVESLFGKVRYIDRRLDAAKVPGVGELNFRPFSREPAKIENPRTGAAIIGEGQTDDPGRGSRFDAALVDEAAFVEHGERVYAAIDDACPSGKALLSTVNGEGNVHARICDEKPQGWTYLRLHWSEHPVYGQGLHVAGEDKACVLCAGNRMKLLWSPQEPKAHRYPGKLTSPWYDQRVIGKTEEQVANELDIDRERALMGRVYSEFSTEMHVVAGGIGYDQALGMTRLDLFCDPGLDTTAVIVCQDAPEDYRVIGLLEMGDMHGTTATPERVAAELIELLADLGIPRQFLAPSWTLRLHGVMDPFSGKSRSLNTGRPFFEAYRKQGFNFTFPPMRYVHTVEPSIAAVKRLMLGTPKPLRVCGVRAADFAVHARNNTWPTDATGRRRIGSTTPHDDAHNHCMRAFAYGIVKKWPPPMVDDGQVRQSEEQDLRDHGGGQLTGFRPGMSL